jgi:transposase InsO family protein
LDPQVAEAILELRKNQPRLAVTAILERLRAQGIIQADNGCSRSTIYRFLQREGLDRHCLRALANEVGGPTKAWESDSPNALWMVDAMDGPSLRSQGKAGAQRTWLLATLDDHSRLSPHAQFYPHQKITALLDCLRQAFERRGLPEALYTDRGKIFTGSQLQLVCANLGIRLLHARPYAAWSRGKIERFFRTLQGSFLPELKFEPATDLEQLNRRLWNWIENSYHRRSHTALGGKSPLERFSSVRLRPLPENWQALFYERIKRRVRLDATVSLEAQLWEVPVHLRGREIELRRDPFEPSRIEVWYQGRLCGRATRCDKLLNNHFSSNNYEGRNR